MKTPHWSTRLELVLAEPSALRVLDTASIIQVAKNVRRDISKPSVERRLVIGLDCRRATPEAALLHWLYLSGSPRSRMSAPPLDLDLGAVDLKRLKRLATGMHLDANLTIWRDRNASQEA